MIYSVLILLFLRKTYFGRKSCLWSNGFTKYCHYLIVIACHSNPGFYISLNDLFICGNSSGVECNFYFYFQFMILLLSHTSSTGTSDHLFCCRRCARPWESKHEQEVSVLKQLIVSSVCLAVGVHGEAEAAGVGWVGNEDWEVKGGSYRAALVWLMRDNAQGALRVQRVK